MHRTLGLLLWLMMSVLCSGCTPVAWIAPPLKLDVGAGVGNTTYASEDPNRSDVQKTGGVFNLRGSVEPLAGIRGFEERLLDVSAGYGVHYTRTRQYAMHGPFLGATVLVPVGDVGVRRLILGSQLHANIGQREQAYTVVGNRVTGRIGFEWSSWEEGPIGDCSHGDGGFCGRGYKYGELGISPYLEMSRAQLLGRSQWAWTVGVAFRLPASMGSGFLVGGF